MSSNDQSVFGPEEHLACNSSLPARIDPSGVGVLPVSPSGIGSILSFAPAFFPESKSAAMCDFVVHPITVSVVLVDAEGE